MTTPTATPCRTFTCMAREFLENAESGNDPAMIHAAREVWRAATFGRSGVARASAFNRFHEWCASPDRATPMIATATGLKPITHHVNVALRVDNADALPARPQPPQQQPCAA